MPPKRRSAPRLAWLLALAAGCHGGACGSTIDAAAVGPLGNVDDVDFAPYLAVAHAIVRHAPPPDVHPHSRAGQRAFVTYWSPGHDAVRATGLGATLLESVEIASREVAGSAAGEGRVEIDVLTSAVGEGAGHEMRDKASEVGVHGYLASDARGVGFVVPNEIVADKLIDYEAQRGSTLALLAPEIRARLASRAHVAPEAIDSMRLARYEVSEHLEGAAANEPPLSLYRSMPPLPTSTSAEELLGSVRSATDYLARMVDDQGRFTYTYDPVRDTVVDEGDYSLLRHAGAAYAMMEAYAELRVPEWTAPAERAVAYLFSRVTVTADGTFLGDEPRLEQQKVGGAGLALLVLTRYQATTGDMRYLPVVRDLGRFIVHQQYPDGHLRDNADVVREVESKRGKKLPKEVFFYVGEAVFGLLRLYAVDPDPEWLASARKAADWVIDVRDAKDDVKHQVPDHWMAYALRDLVVLTGERRYADHAFKIGHAIALGAASPPPAPDYAGSFSEQGDSSPSATRLEAVAAQIEIARWLRDAEDEAWLRPLAVRLACFTRRQQLDVESVYLAKNPGRAIGGVRESLLNDDLRVDFVQHAQNGWLLLARELRDPGWGKGPRK